MSEKISFHHYAASGFPAICVSTSDEDRAIAQIVETFADRQIFRIAGYGGLRDAKTGNVIDDKYGYPQAIARAASTRDCIVIMLDFQQTLGNPHHGNYTQAYRMFRDALPAVKAKGSILILLAPAWKLPAEIEHDVAVMSDTLPTRTELRSALDKCMRNAGVTLTPERIEQMLDAASGLTLAEAENSFALAYSACETENDFDPAIVSEQKMRLIKQSGLVEIIPPADIESLGGMGVFRECLLNEIIPSLSDPELAVSGVLFDGVAGTGKTLGARIIGGKLGYPIMKVDMASLKAQSGGIVGQSEKGIIDVFRKARAVAPVVLFFDEGEKGFAGSSSSNPTSNGVNQGMLGTALTQLTEIRDNREKVFVVMTTNDFQALPVELTRRFEIKFFVDIPRAWERVDIAAKKLAQFVTGSVTVLAQKLADIADDFTGSEIEDLVRIAARRTKRAITEESLIAAHKDVKPIAKTRADEVRRLREWGTENLRLANSVDPSDTGSKKTRKLSKLATRELSPIDAAILESASQGDA